jgi:hypothetical protein
VALNNELSRHRLHYPPSGDCYARNILDAGEHDEKFISAEPDHGVLFTRETLKSFRSVLQEKVADRVPEGVVDDFETVEIEEQKRNFVIVTTSMGERLCQSILK